MRYAKLFNLNPESSGQGVFFVEQLTDLRPEGQQYVDWENATDDTYVGQVFEGVFKDREVQLAEVQASLRARAQKGLKEAFSFTFPVDPRQEAIHRDKFKDATCYLFTDNAAQRESLKPAIKAAASVAEWTQLEVNSDVTDPYQTFANIIYNKGIEWRVTQYTIDNMRRRADDMIDAHTDYISLIRAFNAYEDQVRTQLTGSGV